MLTATTIEQDQVKAFLRRIVRDRSEWRCRASADTGWRILFFRDVEPRRVGDAAERIEVQTDIEVANTAVQTRNQRSFSDSEEVICPACKRMSCGYTQTTAIAELALLGTTRFCIYQRLGSTSSSKLGLAWLDLTADLPKSGAGITLDSTTYANGKLICYGSCE